MSLSVLLVEDDETTLALMSEVIASLGLKVDPVSDSEKASILISEKKFDGIFLDLMMPRLSGFALARQVRQSSRNKRTPIVIVTGQVDKETMQRSFAAGGTFFLQKPVSRKRLIRLLNATRGSMLEERRRLKRVSVRTEVKYEVASRKNNGMSHNLSRDGILFDGDASLKLGSKVWLSFRLPGQPVAIQAEGLISRVDERERVGVSFVYVSEGDRQRIRDLLASLEDEKTSWEP